MSNQVIVMIISNKHALIIIKNLPKAIVKLDRETRLADGANAVALDNKAKTKTANIFSNFLN